VACRTAKRAKKGDLGPYPQNIFGLSGSYGPQRAEKGQIGPYPQNGRKPLFRPNRVIWPYHPIWPFWASEGQYGPNRPNIGQNRPFWPIWLDRASKGRKGPNRGIPPKWPKTTISAKSPIWPYLASEESPIWPYLASEGQNGPFGPLRANMSQIGHFGPFWAIFGLIWPYWPLLACIGPLRAK
jgi:hypothetical protein